MRAHVPLPSSASNRVAKPDWSSVVHMPAQLLDALVPQIYRRYMDVKQMLLEMSWPFTRSASAFNDLMTNGKPLALQDADRSRS